MTNFITSNNYTSILFFFIVLFGAFFITAKFAHDRDESASLFCNIAALACVFAIVLVAKTASPYMLESFTNSVNNYIDTLFTVSI